MLHGGERFVHGFHADTVVAQLAGRDEVVENAEHVGLAIQLRRRTMQLQEIQRVHLEVGEAAIDPGNHVLA